MVEFKTRWKKESPLFFKKLTKIGNWLTASGISIISVPALIKEANPEADFNLALLGSAASYMVLAGILISIISKLTIK